MPPFGTEFELVLWFGAGISGFRLYMSAGIARVYCTIGDNVVHDILEGLSLYSENHGHDT